MPYACVRVSAVLRQACLSVVPGAYGSRDVETREVQCMGGCSYKVSIVFMVAPTSSHISDNVIYESGGSGNPPASLTPYTSACTILFKSAQCAQTL